MPPLGASRATSSGAPERRAGAQAGHRVRLGERAHHEQVGQLGDQPRGVLAVGVELAERLVDDHGDAVRHARAEVAQRAPRQHRAGRVGRAAQQHGAGGCAGALEQLRGRGRDGQRAPAGGLDQLRQRLPARPADERVAAAAEQHRAGGAQQLAGAVAQRDLAGRDAVARGERLAHGRRVASGYALSARRSANVAALTASGCGGSCQAVPDRSSGSTRLSARRFSSSRRARSSSDTSSGGISSNCR